MFDDVLRTIGRPSIPVDAEILREVTADDVRETQAVKGVKTVSIDNLRSSHHSLARVLAAGTKMEEASAITGYTMSRIGTLRQDPAFRELETFYRNEIDKSFVDFAGRMAAVSTDALEVIHERILDNPDDLSIGALTDLVKMGADRTGYGPATKSTVTNVNIDLGARLEAARRRVEHVRLAQSAEGSAGPTRLDGDDNE
jgi:hypothetical protein